MRRGFRLLTLGACAAILTMPDAVVAQEVQYTTKSKVEFGGALGRMMKIFGGSNTTTEVTSIKGLKLRTDDADETSTILDVANQQYTFVDHESKTFYRTSLAEMMAAGERMAQAMADSMEAAQAREDDDPEEPKVEYEVHFSTDRTGRTKDFLGYTAEQAFLTLEITAKEVDRAEGDQDDEEEEYDRGGTLVVLTELWLSTAFPAWQATQEQQEAWRQASEGYAPSTQGMQQAFAFDPRIKEGMERLAEEMQGLEGTTVRSVTHIVTVPYGMKLDRAIVLRDADRSLGDDMGDAAGNAAKESAKGAIGGITGGLFGKKKKEEPKRPEPKQATVVRVTSDITDVNRGPLADSLFTPPTEYTERTPEWMAMPAGESSQ